MMELEAPRENLAPSPSFKRDLHKDLLGWYDVHRRKLPWREHPSPYRTWISEIMLQQTQVKTALPHYERFLERFPDIGSLARAGERTVLRYWAGLGYYSRAKNLVRAARILRSKHAGRYPDTWEELRALPGIGPYTAGAVLSIAFGKPYPVLDGNVARVLARLFAVRRPVKRPEVQKNLWALARNLLHPCRPGDWNQAMMELGALVCAPQFPLCASCPLARRCGAKRLGLEETLPVRDPSREPVSLFWTCLWIEENGKILLWKRSDSERLLPGHWSFPEAGRLECIPGPVLCRARHSITHHRITLELRSAGPCSGSAPDNTRWVPRSQLDRYLVSSLWRKAIPNASRKGSLSVGNAWRGPARGRR